MNKKHSVHNLIILDESGSMSSIKETTIQGFNEIVQTIKGIQEQFPEQEHFISLISFNSLVQKLLHFIDPVSKLKEINDRTYKPDASTPLYDAMGFGLNKLNQHLLNQTDYNVLVTVLTDGAENASREFTGSAIKKLVEELKEKNWTFTYIGADHDVEKMAATMSINNTLVFDKSDEGVKEMFDLDKLSRIEYSRKIRMNEETQSDYFNTPAEEKK